MDRTSLGLTKIAVGESPWQDGGSFFGRNQDIIDHLLRIGALTHRHDAHAPLADPATAPDLTTTPAGGELPSDTPVNVAFTAIDADGGETLVSPVATIDTPPPSDVPAPFAVAPDYTQGNLPAGTYYYALTATDASGGETPPSNPVLITLEAGHANGAVLLSGLTAAIGGAAGWRLYRAANGGDYGFLAAGSADAYTDDCSDCADTTLPPPDDLDNSTAGTATVSATVAGAALPASTVSYRLYASLDPTFPSPSLVGEYLAADAGTPHDVTTLALTPGQPPAVSTSLGGAMKITDADVDLRWRAPVATAVDLPTVDNTPGDARVSLDDFVLHVWGADNAWHDATGGGGGGGGGGLLFVASSSDLPVSGSDGDAYLVIDEGKIAYWDTTSGDWLRLVDTDSGLQAYDEGVALGEVYAADFVGAGVSLTVDGTQTPPRLEVNIPAGGPTGPAGINTPVPWDPATNYVVRDTVTRNGSFYYALAPSLNVDPATDDGTHWLVLAVKGVDGTNGVDGADGAPGTPGAAGANGVIATVEDESSALAAHSKLNFLGAGVTVTANAGTDSYDVAIPGGGGGAAPMIDEDFTALPAFIYSLGAATDLAVSGGTMKSATQNEVQAWLTPTAIDSRQLVKVKAGTNGAINAAPMARRIDDNNFLMMGFYGSGGVGAIQMYAYDAGAWITVGAQVTGIVITAGAWYWIVFRVIGDTGKMRGEVWDIDPRKDPDRAMLAPLASTTVTLATAQKTKFAGVNGRCGLRNSPASAGGGANALTYEVDKWVAVSLDAPGNDF